MQRVNMSVKKKVNSARGLHSYHMYVYMAQNVLGKKICAIVCQSIHVYEGKPNYLLLYFHVIWAHFKPTTTYSRQKSGVYDYIIKIKKENVNFHDFIYFTSETLTHLIERRMFALTLWRNKHYKSDSSVHKSYRWRQASDV